jgi:DNA-binding beta-propeller fold protein YncE
MPKRPPVVALLAGAGACAALAFVATRARAEMMIDEPFMSTPTFELSGAPLGKTGKPDVSPAHLAGSTIAVVGTGALAIDEDSGQLVRVDAKGAVTARLDIAPGAAQLVYDAGTERAYVSDRMGDQITVVAVGKKKLVQKAHWTTPTEPWGLALSPDGKTLLVTTIADRTLVAFDTATGKQRWERALSREPRGVAIAPDGESAMVAYLTTGTVERVSLTGDDSHAGVHVPLPDGSAQTNNFNVQPMNGFVTQEAAARDFARNAFAVRVIGHDIAVVGFQESTPVQIAGGENTGSYGGGFDPPVEHEIAFIASRDGKAPETVAARIILHQPDAIGWDSVTDRMVVAGYGSDDILIIDNASQPSVALNRWQGLGAPSACGPNGVAVTGDTAWVWCSLSRQVVQVGIADSAVALGAEATTSRRSALEQAGLAMFRAGNDARISSRGAMACSSCHPDAREDGLSWRIDSRELQTPLLTGRVLGTHPFKWDGSDKNLAVSLTSTMQRLGGTGLDETEVKQMSAYLESLPPPRVPARDRKQVARGKKLFHSDALGCDTCHSGKHLSDGSLHDLGSDMDKVDTPSLIGVAASAPYYHDGSAPTLEALLRDTGLVHGMADFDELDDQEIADLVAYLETL